MTTRARLVASERWFNRLVIVSFGFGFALLALIAISALYAVGRNQAQADWIAHTYQVKLAITDADLGTTRVEATRRALLLADNPTVSHTFHQVIDEALPDVDRVLRLTADNRRQQRRGTELRSLTERYVADARVSVAMIERGNRARAVAEFRIRSPFDLLLRRRVVAQEMMAEEDNLLATRVGERRTLANILYALLALAAVIVGVLGVASIVMVLRYTRDLTRSRNQLRLLNDDLEGAVRERTTDLQRANDEIQRFAYIVSHDLRSPLVNVMGFTAELETATKVLAELVDKAVESRPETVDPRAIEAIRHDLPEATGFIRTSTQKMDRLINAILRLSREGRRTVMPEQLDMAAMARTVADSLRIPADKAGAEIRPEIDQLSIVSDRVGVEQILSNLVENAVKYLKPGRPGIVQIRGRRADGRAIIEVIDNGRGIDPRDHERVFDLFRRSGVQDQPGEGIGLAHVRAMAYRLGGAISVTSELDAGAAFRLSLPLAYAGEGSTP